MNSRYKVPSRKFRHISLVNLGPAGQEMLCTKVVRRFAFVQTAPLTMTSFYIHLKSTRWMSTWQGSSWFPCIQVDPVKMDRRSLLSSWSLPRPVYLTRCCNYFLKAMSRISYACGSWVTHGLHRSCRMVSDTLIH